ncbi:MAG: hypothetical protein FWG90_01815 [Oscillospiraceae bacterium]|nr:hypothetical protein [Oscillospiraceae bacterium]
MKKGKLNGALDTVPAISAVITAVIVSGYYKMGFWETFLSGLLAGLVVLIIAWVFKNMGKKKIKIILIPKKLTNGKFRVTVLIWNPSFARAVFNSDYGERGLGIIVDYGAVVAKLSKPKKIMFAKSFSFSEIPDTAKNTLNLNMSDLGSNAFIEFDFEIHNIGESPNISLRYDREKITIRELKYSKIIQTIHYICAAISAIAIIVMVLSALFGFAANAIIVSILLAIFSSTVSFALGDFIPPVVVKHMKLKGYIK